MTGLYVIILIDLLILLLLVHIIRDSDGRL